MSENHFRRLVTTQHPAMWMRGARWGLRLLGFPYQLAMIGRNAAYRYRWFSQHAAGIPVVSIGNLSVGGTGKSPMVAWVCRWFRERDVRVAILSRGYGQLDSGQNDEALELELSLPDVPHLQHWDRVASAQLAREELEMQVLVLDDGFQHRRLHRDLDIVLIDATDPSSARHVLPGGLLREPISSLRRAQVVVLTRADQVTTPELTALKSMIQRVAPAVHVLEARHHPRELWLHGSEPRSLESLQGMRILAFCGIGNPDSFTNTLVNLGAEVVGQRIFPDHHAYTAEDVAALADWSRQCGGACAIVCTVKDWVKLQTRRIGNIELMALAIEMDLMGNVQPLEKALEEVLAKAKTQAAG